MSIESVGVYSPNTVYGELTMPFLSKPVTINAHTAYDKDDNDVVLTKNKFYNNKSKMQVSIEDIRDMKGLELDENIITKVGPEVKTDILSQNLLPSFQLSNLSNGTGVVYEALQNGYTGSQAIKIGKAHKAYTNVLNQDFTKTVQNLINTSYKVA